jgi:hypothetical protein
VFTLVKSLFACMQSARRREVAQKIQVTQVSDLSGLDGAETVRFALDGAEYEIDLLAPEAEELRASVAPFAAHARRVKAGRPPRRNRQQARSDLPQIREYMRQRGHKVNDRGRVPDRIVAEYDLLTKYEARQ